MEVNFATNAVRTPCFLPISVSCLLAETAASIDGYDGVFNIANLTKGYIKHADLTQRHKLGVHDWVLCLEVGY